MPYNGLAKTSTITHKLGGKITTPLLVPSFSSKGFSVQGGEYEVKSFMKFASQMIEESFLVSAYDIAHKHILQPSRFPLKARLTFVDSGGYEVTDGHDLSTVLKHEYPLKDWEESMHLQVLDKWPKSRPAVFVSYDDGEHRYGLKKQIKNAHALFSKYPDHLHEFLIKPERQGNARIDMSNVLSLVENLRDFHIIGLTEKELGNSIFERMLNIAKIRLALNDAKLNIPLHVFGSLDPVTTCLYFISGAEIFDGLTWLRYGYLNGHALYYQNYGFLSKETAIKETDERAFGYMMLLNLRYLTMLRDSMTSFLVDGDFNKFGTENGAKMSEAYNLLRAELGGRI